MTFVTCAMAWLCAVLMVPLMLFIWALDTKRTRINRYRSYGWSWKKIADIYDFICIPPADPSISFLMQQNLIKKQLERIDEFSHISLNHDDNSVMIENLKEEWKIEE